MRELGPSPDYYCPHCDVFNAYEDEHARCGERGEVLDAIPALPRMPTSMAEWVDSCAQRDRYRQALEKIATEDIGHSASFTLVAIVKLARRALTEGDDPK